MRRPAFLTLVAAAFAPLRARAQDDIDPAMTSRQPQLRVLLGRGDAVAAANGFLYEGHPYRGTFTRLDDGSIVSTVGLEEYLYSVVAREMSPSWPQAALQAQAICARTYVLQRSSPRRSYDVVPSEADQVYAGIDAESAGTRAAVDATAGLVLRYGSGFASVAYSSCCGGHTESSAEAWTGGATLPYLAGVPCTWCEGSPNYRWSVDVALDRLSSAFAAALAPYGDLTDLRVAGVDASGRARSVELVAQRGSTFIKGSEFRSAAGARVVRSLLITSMRTQPFGASPTQATATVAIEGGGLGHGVGMCQWGARGLASAGRSARDILACYFPGTELTTD